MYFRFSILFLIPLFLLLPGCGPQYKSKSLASLSQNTAHYQETKDEITVQARLLNKKEINYIFSNKASRLLNGKSPIYPIEITITNNSKNVITCNPEDTDLAYAKPQEVVRRLQENTTRNTAFIAAASVGILALCTIGIGIVGLTLALSGISAGITGLGIGIALCGGLLFLTPTASIFYKKSSVNFNKEVSRDISDKTISHIASLNPKEKLSFILFADGRLFKPSFLMNIDNQKNKTSFIVKLHQSK